MTLQSLITPHDLFCVRTSCLGSIGDGSVVAIVYESLVSLLRADGSHSRTCHDVNFYNSSRILRQSHVHLNVQELYKLLEDREYRCLKQIYYFSTSYAAINIST